MAIHPPLQPFETVSAFRSVSATGPDDIWILPAGTTSLNGNVAGPFVMHFDGTSWTPYERGEDFMFERKIFAAHDEAWVLSSERVQQGFGRFWRNVTPVSEGVTYEDLWVSGEGRPWLLTDDAGAGNRVFVYDGFNWTETEGDGLRDGYARGIWAGDAGEAWAVGLFGCVNYFDGRSWCVVDAGHERGVYLDDVFVVGGFVWAVGDYGVVLRRPAVGTCLPR